MLSLNAFKRWLENYGTPPRYYNPALNYMWSKVAVSAYAAYAHDTWRASYGDCVSAVVVDPGLIDTRLIRGWPAALSFRRQSIGAHAESDRRRGWRRTRGVSRTW
jgi:NAD(P)-dependent dehydrogenase (short-subunit alcohol dehydrogenase family)